MLSAEYFRRQADICVRLSLIASDDEVSNRLITMARRTRPRATPWPEAMTDASPAADRGNGGRRLMEMEATRPPTGLSAPRAN
jgi:hypothetical protein